MSERRQVALVTRSDRRRQLPFRLFEGASQTQDASQPQSGFREARVEPRRLAVEVYNQAKS